MADPQDNIGRRPWLGVSSFEGPAVVKSGDENAKNYAPPTQVKTGPKPAYPTFAGSTQATLEPWLPKKKLKPGETTGGEGVMGAAAERANYGDRGAGMSESVKSRFMGGNVDQDGHAVYGGNNRPLELGLADLGGPIQHIFAAAKKVHGPSEGQPITPVSKDAPVTGLVGKFSAASLGEDVGGAAGAAGGAAIGTAVAPGIGTDVGAAGGEVAGRAAGGAVEKWLAKTQTADQLVQECADKFAKKLKTGAEYGGMIGDIAGLGTGLLTGNPIAAAGVGGALGGAENVMTGKDPIGGAVEGGITGGLGGIGGMAGKAAFAPAAGAAAPTASAAAPAAAGGSAGAAPATTGNFETTSGLDTKVTPSGAQYSSGSSAPAASASGSSSTSPPPAFSGSGGNSVYNSMDPQGQAAEQAAAKPSSQPMAGYTGKNGDAPASYADTSFADISQAGGMSVIDRWLNKHQSTDEAVQACADNFMAKQQPPSEGHGKDVKFLKGNVGC